METERSWYNPSLKYNSTWRSEFNWKDAILSPTMLDCL